MRRRVLADRPPLLRVHHDGLQRPSVGFGGISYPSDLKIVQPHVQGEEPFRRNHAVEERERACRCCMRRRRDRLAEVKCPPRSEPGGERSDAARAAAASITVELKQTRGAPRRDRGLGEPIKPWLA